MKSHGYVLTCIYADYSSNRKLGAVNSYEVGATYGRNYNESDFHVNTN